MSTTDPLLERQPPATSDGEQATGESSSPAPAAGARLKLTDFLDVNSLQEVQDSFSALSRLTTLIRDAEGNPLTTPTDAKHQAQSDQWLELLLSADADEDGVFSAPIVVEGQALGSIVIEPERFAEVTPVHRARFRKALDKLGLSDADKDALTKAAEESFMPSRAASIQFLYLLANSITRLCYQEYHAKQRLEELSALYKISTLLSGQRDVQQVLDAAARSAGEVMHVKAVAIRLLKETKEGSAERELVPRAVYNLSEQFLNSGAINCAQSALYGDALRGEVQYVENMSCDERVVQPEHAQREGLASMLCAGIVYQGKPIGVIQLFTGEPRKFTRFEVNLTRAMTNLLATAIENARLDQARRENQRMIRQLHLAADVQRRMLPGAMPHLPPFEVAARYVPSFELGGDFYDFINLDGHLGIAVGDVVGKGIAASLLMASVRGSLRAYAQDLYDLDEVISRVNVALCRDTLDNEFATLWYGVLDPSTMRLTYCNAGHEPPLLLRRGELHVLGVGGMLVGVDAQQHYDKGIWHLERGDLILLYTDGLVDAFNAEGKRFGRKRIEQALRESADKSANDALNHILWSMRKFTGLRRSLDDTTLVVVKVG